MLLFRSHPHFLGNRCAPNSPWGESVLPGKNGYVAGSRGRAHLLRHRHVVLDSYQEPQPPGTGVSCVSCRGRSSTCRAHEPVTELQANVRSSYWARVVAKPVAAIEDATLGCNCVTPLHRLVFARKPNTWTSSPGLTPGDGLNAKLHLSGMRRVPPKPGLQPEYRFGLRERFPYPEQSSYRGHSWGAFGDQPLLRCAGNRTAGHQARG